MKMSSWQTSEDAEEREKDEWSSDKYENPPKGCPKCGRYRIEKCANGKHWCEKCNWVIEDDKYFEPDWRT